MPNSVTEKPLSSSELFSPDHWQVVTTAPSLLGECKYNWLCTHVNISCRQGSVIKAARQAGPCTAKTFPRCFKNNKESSARAHVGKGCSLSMQCKGWPADPWCAQAAAALGGNPGIKSRLKKALHLTCPSTDRVGNQMCQAASLKEEEKSVTRMLLEHPEPAKVLPGFELKQCRRLGGADSFFLFCLFYTSHFQVPPEGLSSPALQNLHCSSLTASASVLCLPPNRPKIQDQNWGSLVRSELAVKGKEQESKPMPRLPWENRPFSNGCVRPVLSPASPAAKFKKKKKKGELSVSLIRKVISINNHVHRDWVVWYTLMYSKAGLQNFFYPYAPDYCLESWEHSFNPLLIPSWIFCGGKISEGWKWREHEELQEWNKGSDADWGTAAQRCPETAAKGCCRGEGNNLFFVRMVGQTRNNEIKLQLGKFNSDIRKYFLMVKDCYTLE